MGAAQRHGFHYRVGPGRAESKRHVAVADRGRTVHHRPLVHAEAVQAGGTACTGAQQFSDELDGVDAGAQIVERHRHPIGVLAVARAVQVPPRGSAEHDAEAGMPDPQLPGPQAVVLKQEVPHRMWLAHTHAAKMRLDEFLDPAPIFVGSGGPVALGKQCVSHRGSGAASCRRGPRRGLRGPRSPRHLRRRR